MVLHKIRGALHKAMPRIVSISSNSRSLLDYKNEHAFRYAGSALASEAKFLLDDHEVKLLIVWAIISPLAGIAYLLWVKYKRLKWLAIPLFFLSILQFIGQWSGLLWLLNRAYGIS